MVDQGDSKESNESNGCRERRVIMIKLELSCGRHRVSPEVRENMDLRRKAKE